MARLLLAGAAWLGLASVSWASVAAHKEGPLFGKERPPVRAAQLATQALELTATGGNRSEYVVTEQTEILLNDQPCKYADIPAHARIVRMELAADKKTVLRILFRSAK